MNRWRKWLRRRFRPYIYMSVDELIHKRKKTVYWMVVDYVFYVVLTVFAALFLFSHLEIFNAYDTSAFTNKILFLIMVDMMVFNLVLHLMTHRHIDLISDRQNKQYIELVQYIKENITGEK